MNAAGLVLSLLAGALLLDVAVEQCRARADRRRRADAEQERQRRILHELRRH